MDRLSMPHIQVKHKTLDLYFEHLDPESRKKLYEDLKAGYTIKTPHFEDHPNPVKEYKWSDLDDVDKHKIEEVVNSKQPFKSILRYNEKTKSCEKIGMTQANRVVSSFLKLAGYDREKIKPGYKGRFVIHSHFAEKAGHHFDLRLEFPVTSLHAALGAYEGKRLPGTREPMEKYPDKPGTVYRSFAVRKHTLPTSGTKLFIVETEDHPIQYGGFTGEIEEGYGKGKVDIFDKGTYELLDVEGDKKYTIDFKGKKLNGIYAFVKYQRGYLWVKTKDQEKRAFIKSPKPTIFEKTIYRLPTKEELIEVDSRNLSADEILDGFMYTIVGRGIMRREEKNTIIEAIQTLSNMFPDNTKYKEALSKAKDIELFQPKRASAIDYVRPEMSPELWYLKDIPELLPSIKEAIIKTLVNACEASNLVRPFEWIEGLYISGSAAGYNYQEDGDVDLDVIYTAAKFKQCNPSAKGLSDEDIFSRIKDALYKANYNKIGTTSHTYSFMVLKEGDKPSGDAVYDMLKGKWASPPIRLPEDFDPDIAFSKQRQLAWKIASNLDFLIGEIVRTADQYKKLDQFVRQYGKYQERRVALLAKLKGLCQELDRFHTVINQLTVEAKTSQKPVYPAFSIGPNWDERQIIFKYLARSGYHRPVHILYQLIGNDPIKKLIDKFIPD